MLDLSVISHENVTFCTLISIQQSIRQMKIKAQKKNTNRPDNAENNLFNESSSI